MNVMETDCEDVKWTELAEDGVHWWILNLWVVLTEGEMWLRTIVCTEFIFESNECS